MGSPWMLLPNLAVKDQVTAWNPTFIKVTLFQCHFEILPSQFTSFHTEEGKVEEGQLMVIESCVDGMRNV